MKRKIHLLMLIALSMICLAGWGAKKVELLDDAKLINLDQAIELAKPGGEWDKQNQHNGSGQDDGTSRPNDKDSIEYGEEVVVISIRNKLISYKNRNMRGIDVLEELLRQDNAENIAFSLRDNWAEAHVYKDVRALLADLHSEIGLRYTEE